MPFKSIKQMRAAFGGFLGPKMKARAKLWAKETPNISKLPMKKYKEGSKKEEKGESKRKEMGEMKKMRKGKMYKVRSAAQKMFGGKY